MANLLPREYINEVDQFYEIKSFLRKEKYFFPFKYLYNRFYKEGQNFIKTGQLMMDIRIVECSQASNLLTSFCVFGLLEKVKRPGSKLIFIPKNKNLWFDLWEATEELRDSMEQKYNGSGQSN